jgi:hypothetical protein
VGWFSKKAQTGPLLADAGPAASQGAQNELLGLLPDDRARLSAEGASAGDIAWIDAWLRDAPERTLQGLTQQEDRLVVVLRGYREFMAEFEKSNAESWDRLNAARDMVTASLAQIDRDVLERGFAEISANDKMKPAHKNILLGLIRTALECKPGLVVSSATFRTTRHRPRRDTRNPPAR